MARIKMSFSAGLIIRRALISAIKDACFYKDVQCNIEEDRGFITSDYRILITGDDNNIRAVLPVLKNIIREAEGEKEKA